MKLLKISLCLVLLLFVLMSGAEEVGQESIQPETDGNVQEAGSCHEDGTCRAGAETEPDTKASAVQEQQELKNEPELTNLELENSKAFVDESSSSLPDVQNSVDKNMDLEKVIELEIRETLEMIKLQQEKLHLLEKVRSDLIEGDRISLHDKKLLSSIRDKTFKPSSPSEDSREPVEKSFFDFFASQFSSDHSEIVSVDLLPLRFRNTIARKAAMQGYMDSIMIDCIGFSNGTIVFMDQLKQAFIAEHHTGHRAPLVRIFAVPSNMPFLATVSRDGETRVHNVTAFFGEHRFVGRQPLPDGLNETENSVTLVTKLETVIEMDKDLGDISTVSVLTARKSDLIIIGDEKGLVKFFKRDGELLPGGNLQLPKPITGIRSTGPSLAIAQGEEIVFVKLSPSAETQSVQANRCQGEFGRTIVDISYDILRSTIVYAATDTGDLLVFHTRKRIPSTHGSKATTGCQLIHKIAPTNENVSRKVKLMGMSGLVSTVRGYVIHVSGDLISIYNTTRIISGPPELVASKEFPFKKNAFLPHILKAVSHGTSREAGFSLIIGNECTRENEKGCRFSVYESLLPYQQHQQKDMGWVRGPMMMMAIVLFAAYQIYSKKAGRGRGVPSNMFSPSGRSMGGFSPDMKEFSALSGLSGMSGMSGLSRGRGRSPRSAGNPFSMRNRQVGRPKQFGETRGQTRAVDEMLRRSRKAGQIPEKGLDTDRDLSESSEKGIYAELSD